MKFSKPLIALVLSVSCLFGGNVAMASGHSGLPATSELKQYIDSVERYYRIPKNLLVAIAKVESGGKPYAINIAGQSVIARDKIEASRVIRSALNQGITNVDIGLMQINYRWHKENFVNIEEMLNPKRNIHYAAKLLLALRKQHGSWQKAIRHYHSSTPERHRIYAKKIVTAWMKYV